MDLRSITRTISRAAALVSAMALMATPAGAAIGDHIWSRGFPTDVLLAIDGSDHLVAHSNFFGTVDLGGGPLTPANFLSGDQYLARYDASGNHIWSMQFTPGGPGVSNPLVTADPDGNIYITGHLNNGADIDYGGGTIAGPQAYVAKFNSNGNHIWSAGFGDGWPRSIAANNTHVVVTGYTSAGVDFGGGTVGAAGGYDIFVAQLTAAGAHSWSAGFGDASDQGGFAVTIDGSGNVLLVGSMFGTADFGGGALVANGLDLFLASFTSSGTHSWSQVFDGVFTPGGGILVTTDVAAGPSGEVTICGELLNSTDFGGGTITSNGFGDWFVAQFDASGNHQWSAAYGSANGTDPARSISVDGTGNVLVTGGLAGDADLGGGTIAHNGASWDLNIFVAVYNSTGTHLFSAGYGTNAGVSQGHFDSTDQMLIHGRGGTNIDFGGGPISPESYFIAKLEGANGPPTGIGDLPHPDRDGLRAFPNPFNPATTIVYFVETPGQASLTVYDARGRLVEEVVPARWHDAGRHTARFVAGASGVYFARLRAGGRLQTIKAAAIK